MTLYEELYKKLVIDKKDDYFLSKNGHWFDIDLDPDLETNTVRLVIRYYYEYHGDRSIRDYAGERVEYTTQNLKVFIREIVKYIIMRVNYDIRAYNSAKKLDLSFKQAIKEIIESKDPVTGDFYGWKKAD